MDEKLGFVLVFGFVLALVRLALQLVISAVPAQMVADLQAQLRMELFDAFTRASWSEQSQDREGYLQELVTNQVAQAIQTSIQAATLVVAGLAFLVLVASALALNVLAALVVLLASTGIFAVLRPLSTMGGRQGRALSRESLDYAGGVNEAVRIAEEAHVFGAGPALRACSDALVAPLSISFFRINFLARLVPGTYQGLIYLLVMAALAVLYLVGSAQVASLTAVVLLLVRAGMYGQQAQTAYTALRQAIPYLERLDQAKLRYLSSSPARGQRTLEAVRSIAFERVSFGYVPGTSVLTDVEFEVTAGEAIGIVGPSGAGKSTLLQLLLRLRSPDDGRYLINGVLANEFQQEHWQLRLAYVPQVPRLLHASVTDNIRFFRALDFDAVQHAARLAGIHDDIMAWSNRYETLIGPRADGVSGGQQQRICLARALAGNPDLLVLDEPTSQLDPHSEWLIQESLTALKHQLTLFIVAHRISTLDICERVMVIVSGRLEAFDRVDQLRANNEYYRSVSGSRSSVPLALSVPISPGNGPV
jgi:ABC-type multidrug transport system fused ATPase/permease subunit